MPPLVSVLMTVFNGERFLNATLASILGQTYRNIELLVIDDGSNDATWEMLSQVAAQDNRMQLLRHENNQGVPVAMNRLFKQANGTYVNRHDADDISHTERYTRQVAYLESHPEVGVIGTRVELIDAADQPLDLSFFVTRLGNAEIQAELLRTNCLCQGSVLFRRELLDRVGYYEEGNIGSEDYDLWLRMAEVTQFAVLDEILYQYRIHRQSLSHRRRHEQAFHSGRAVERALARRYNGAIASPQRASAAKLYLQAAVAAYQDNNLSAAQDYVRHAQQIYPQSFDNAEPVTGLWLPHIYARGPTEAIEFTNTLFDNWLPPGRLRHRLKSHWLAEIHIQSVFHDGRHLTPAQLRRHLWTAIRYRPAWLLNRGVLVRLGRAYVKPMGSQGGKNGPAG